VGDHPSITSDLFKKRTLPGAAFFTGLRKAGRHDDDRTHAGRSAVIDDWQDSGRRNGDDSQVHERVNFAHAAKRLQPANVFRRRVDWEEIPLESRRPQGFEHASADRSFPSRCADESNRTGLEQRTNRSHRRKTFAFLCG
jgi:hypothetical protein